MKDWLNKCLRCYHSYYGYNDESYLCCKRADKGKNCRFYGKEERDNRKTAHIRSKAGKYE